MAKVASSPVTGAELAEFIRADVEVKDRGNEESFERRTSSSFLSEELSKSDMRSLDSLTWESLSNSWPEKSAFGESWKLVDPALSFRRKSLS